MWYKKPARTSSKDNNQSNQKKVGLTTIVKTQKIEMLQLKLKAAEKRIKDLEEMNRVLKWRGYCIY